MIVERPLATTRKDVFRMLEAIADHRLVRVPDAGHWLPHDRPALFIEEPGRFFAE